MNKRTLALYSAIREINALKATIVAHKNYLEKGYDKSIYRTIKRTEEKLKSCETEYVALCSECTPQEITQAYTEATQI